MILKNFYFKSSASKVVQLGAAIVLGGGLLFFYVWWPIQAVRNLVLLNKIEFEVSQKKSELNGLQSRYSSLTSLVFLDQWAKTHGPWKSPGPDDILTIQD